MQEFINFGYVKQQHPHTVPLIEQNKLISLFDFKILRIYVIFIYNLITSKCIEILFS